MYETFSSTTTRFLLTPLASKGCLLANDPSGGKDPVHNPKQDVVVQILAVIRQDLRANPATVVVGQAKIDQAKLHQSARSKSYRECERDPCLGWM
jgi:hypothetical protein